MKKLIARLLKMLSTLLNLFLHHFEPLFAPRAYPSEHAPIFIIGAPRSGSTLFYQVLVNRFQFGYFNNLHARYFGFPYLLQLFIGNRMPRNYRVSYQSTHGTTNGAWEPSENGSFWYRWFPRQPQYVPLEKANGRKISRMRRVVAGLISAFDAPILFKNLNCALRLAPMSKAVPDAVFLVIERDPFMIAQSILEGRKRVNGDVRKWWSMQPPDYEEVKHLEPERQVARQIYGIYDLIKQDSDRIGRERFHFVQYEDFCADVHGTVDKVESFLNSRGIEVRVRGDVPSHFDVSQEIKVDPLTRDRLLEALKR